MPNRNEIIKKRLRAFLESQKCAEFLSDKGSLGMSITGEFKKGTGYYHLNEELLNKELDELVKSLMHGF